MNRYHAIALAAGIALAALLVSGPPQAAAGAADTAGGVLITGARIFDGTAVVEADSVRVQGGHIVEIGRGLAPRDGEVVHEAGGATLLPGFIDAHTHSWGRAMADALRFGVTTQLDMFTMPMMLPEQRRRRADLGPQTQADLFSAGHLATVEGGHGTQFGFPVPTVDSDEAAGQWVQARIGEGSDFIKIVREDLSAYRGRPELPSLDAPRAAALVQAAHAAGVKAVVHVSTLEAARESLQAGADGLVHVFGDAAVDAGFIGQAAADGLFVVPTLTVVAGVAGERTPLLEDELLEPLLSPPQRLSLEQRWNLPPRPESIQRARDNVAALHRGGVRILAGTDAPNANTAHGASMHEELAQLVAAGLSPVEALSAATAWPAEAFGLPDRGRVAVGARADLVLVDGQPDQRIGDSRRIVAIWKNGHPVERRLPEAR